MRVSPGVYAESPAFAALQYSRGRSLGEVVALLMELLGTYSLSEEATLPISWGGVWPDERDRKDVEQVHYRCEPAVTMAELRAMARWAKSSHFATFRAAVRIVAPGSASPAETVMFGMLGAPLFRSRTCFEDDFCDFKLKLGAKPLSYWPPVFSQENGCK